MCKTYQLDIARQVSRDLHEIEFYLSKLGAYPENIKKLISNIRNEIRRLGISPLSVPSLNNKTTINTNYRYSTVDGYIIILEVIKDTVKVYRVFSGKQDYLSVLGLY